MLACLSIPQRSLQGSARKISTGDPEIGQPHCIESIDIRYGAVDRHEPEPILGFSACAYTHFRGRC